MITCKFGNDVYLHIFLL